MNPIVRAGLAMFTVGVLLGASASWHISAMLERWRRDRADLRQSIDQARGLAGKVRDQVATVARVAGYAVLALVLLAAAIVAGR